MHSNVIQIDHKLACEQALHLGEIVKSTHPGGHERRRDCGPSRFRRSLARSRAARFARPNRIGELARRLTTNVIKLANTIQTVHTRKNSVLNIRQTKTRAAELFRKTQYPYCN